MAPNIQPGASLKLYDISKPISAQLPPWPGDPAYSSEKVADIRSGAAANVCKMVLGSHFGTHVDGPYHVFEQGMRIGAVPLQAFIGPACVVNFVAGNSIDVADLDGVDLGKVKRILFRTSSNAKSVAFEEHFTYLTPAAAEKLVKAEIVLLGTDAPSVDPFESTNLPVHKILIENGVAILENLELCQVPEGTYELIALPLKLLDADASPVRAVLRKR
ncbi:MAG: cyclase family protein [bacterium]